MGIGSPTQININFKTDDRTYTLKPISNSFSIRTLFITLAKEINVNVDIFKQGFSFLYNDEELDIQSNVTLKNKKIINNSTIIILDGNNRLIDNPHFKREGNNNNENITDNVNDEQKIKDTIKNMALLGCNYRNDIINNKDEEIFMRTSDALKAKDIHLFVLGLIASYLKKFNILTEIENPDKDSCDEDNQTKETKEKKEKKANNLLQILVNGMMFYKKYYFIFNFTKEKIEQMKINENLEKLKNDIRTQTSI